MVFGLMREATHKEIVAKLEKRIDYLETKSFALEAIAASRQETIDMLSETGKHIATPTVKATVKAPVAAPTNDAAKPRVVLTNIHAKKKFMEQLLPDAKFQIIGTHVTTMFNGKQTVVRVATMADYKDTEVFAINRAAPGEIGVLLNKDQSLHSVLIIKKEHLTNSKTKNFVMDVNRPEVAQFAHNTGLVLRNFK